MNGGYSVISPVSLIVSAFAPVRDIRRTLTPQLRLDAGATRLLLIDLGRGRNRLGGSCLAQVYGALGDVPAGSGRARSSSSGFFGAHQRTEGAQSVLAYHDRSDGGLLVTLLEMAFAGHCGLEVVRAAAGLDAAWLHCAPRSSAPSSRCASMISMRCAAYCVHRASMR